MMLFKLTNEQRIKVLRDYGEICDRLVREKERQYITSISRSTAWKLEQVGKFPQRKSIGLKSCGWLLSDLLYWISER
ncbi:helix-turn-helix transcriptional regulator [Yersinia enterocolitica]|uniref:AlpA family phage regulatory protein n=1 Tax=Klebsiella michiganensis TaxID=1134687 RepID=A0ABR5GEP9_9ENTR|nr:MULTISPECIES: AlpA family phage regulatory protein [Enterobacterales]AUW13392.1 AlpA family phage regulatory protein [Klebsiella oxytoca]EKN3528019.1 AlpA family phage regulatory protein [Yersinia enterocolitica]EKN6345135.1 AlpA family phage regulatory protein [Yersinia enterocolitica]ELI8317240.1 AlpA family phage regulatory protein [Yersinia enterocolitica]ELI8321301.1 AlpA family phage regulatory protein [Yersinia enterocolitica]